MTRLVIGLCALALLFVPLDATTEAAGGYDAWGYNYGANIFNGYYDNYLKPNPPVTSGDRLQMKWNDAWLDEDGHRHEGYPTYFDSGAWLTNHIWYFDDAGKKRSYFVKIVAAKSSWIVVGGTWYDENDQEVGPAIWGQFYIAQEVERGLLGKAARPHGPGLGNR